MASEEGCVTITWEIGNFDLLLKSEKYWFLSSPILKIECTEGNAWGKLHASSKSFMNFGLQKCKGFDQNVRCEMSLIPSCGVEQGNEKFFSLPNFQWLSLEKKSLFDDSRQSILPKGTLTLCCKIWGKKIRTMENRISSVLRSLNYLWNIEELASSDSHETYIEQDNFLIYVALKKKNTRTVEVKAEPHLEGCLFSFAACGLSINDGGWVICESSTFLNTRVFFDIEIFPNSRSINLQLESIVALHKGCQEQLKLGEDLLLLYRESALSDATLNTEGKSFSAHRSILAARSPVFRAMFEKDEMNEGRTGVVNIDDVDSDTVDRMLVFLYGDSLGVLEWNEAFALYYAADKYEVLPLKEKCAAILEAGLTAFNACDALVLADKHSDQELMKCVVNFIFSHEEVVSSVQWDELEKRNSSLAAKISRQLFLKTKEMRV